MFQAYCCCLNVVSPLIINTTLGGKSLYLGFMDEESNSLGNKLQSWDFFFSVSVRVYYKKLNIYCGSFRFVSLLK